MRDFTRQAKIAFSCYLDRGERALLALQTGDIAAAEALLAARKAAFHNFMAADAIVQKRGENIALDAEMLRVAGEVVRVNRALAQEIASAMARLRHESRAVGKARMLIGRYRSESVGSKSITNSI
jgi:hypothetical protein